MTSPSAVQSHSRLRTVLGKIFYALCFCLIIPLLVVLSCRQLDPHLTLPPLHHRTIGIGISLLALTGIVSAMLGLKIRGGGLPMNGFPPSRFVSTGIYKLFPHPIYTCSVILCAGLSIATGSAAGLYLFTPLILLGCTAIVWGYERQDLIRRFGVSTPPTLMSLPPDKKEILTIPERIRYFLPPLILWGVLYFIGGYMQLGENETSCRFFGEADIPVNQQASWIYISIYPILLAIILLQRTAHLMRHFAANSMIACTAAFFLYILFPLSCPFLPYESNSLGGTLLAWERAFDLNGGIAFPSYHALWAGLMLAALWQALKNRLVRFLMVLWASALCWSCVVTGMHGWIDIIASLLLLGLVVPRATLLRHLMRIVEKLANSWASRRIGPLRIINHALYTFLAAAGGYYLVLTLAGQQNLLPSLIVMLCSLAGAGLWAQCVEGSPRLLRPFGYYGAILGGIAGILLVALGQGFHLLAGGSTWVLLGAMTAASPWIQAIGRLRCIVQGCCHGRPISATHAHLGLSHTNPSSRVCALSDYSGVPLHATPLYSIGMNLFIGAILLRLWTSAAPIGLIAGLYFALAGLSRFIEEAYRGEPQTRRFCKLSEYQWYAVGLLLAAFVLWLNPSSMIPAPAPVWWSHASWVAFPVGLIYAFAMSMDFPDSHRRYSRLTG